MLAHVSSFKLGPKTTKYMSEATVNKPEKLILSDLQHWSFGKQHWPCLSGSLFIILYSVFNTVYVLFDELTCCKSISTIKFPQVTKKSLNQQSIKTHRLF